MGQTRIQQSKKLMDHNVPHEDHFDDDEDKWPIRIKSSARRYQTDVRTEDRRPRTDVQFVPQRSQGDVVTPSRRAATQTKMPAMPTDRRRTEREVAPPPRERETTSLKVARERRFRPHWLVFVGLAMLIMVVGWVVFNAATSWWQVTQDDWHYGRPRTFQTDTVVGHNDSPANPSHFIALNLNGRIEVIEFPGGDPTKVRIFLGPTLIGDGQNLAAVTLSFKDVNGDGKPDMIVNVQDSHFVFINFQSPTAGTFRPARPDENIHL